VHRVQHAYGRLGAGKCVHRGEPGGHQCGRVLLDTNEGAERGQGRAGELFQSTCLRLVALAVALVLVRQAHRLPCQPLLLGQGQAHGGAQRPGQLLL
jgi:hypothetical protein